MATLSQMTSLFDNQFLETRDEILERLKARKEFREAEGEPFPSVDSVKALQELAKSSPEAHAAVGEELQKWEDQLAHSKMIEALERTLGPKGAEPPETPKGLNGPAGPDMEAAVSAVEKITDMMEEWNKRCEEFNDFAQQEQGLSAIKDFHKVLLPLIRKVMPQVIAHDIVGVQPMSIENGEIFTIKPVYTEQVMPKLVFEPVHIDVDLETVTLTRPEEYLPPPIMIGRRRYGQ